MMHKITLAVFISSLAFAGSLLKAEPISNGAKNEPKQPLDLYLLIGQSNMAGRAPYGKNESAEIENCYLLNGKDQWEPAKNPLNRHSTIRKDLKFQKLGPGYVFSKTMLKKNQGNSIGLIVNARGGSSINDWKKGSHFYREALRRTQEAQKTGTLRGVLWHQGESDSERHAAYLGLLKRLINDLRKDLNIADLPFIAGQVHYDPEKKPNTKEINEQISKLPTELPFTGFVSSENLTTLDNTHFDARSVKILGDRYADKMLEVQAQLKSGQTNPPDKN
jgi:hypothetical protein